MTTLELPFSYPVLLLLVAWDLAWRGIALWTAAHRKEKGWFIALLVVNSIGVLPVLYLWLRGWFEGCRKNGDGV